MKIIIEDESLDERERKRIARHRMERKTDVRVAIISLSVVSAIFTLLSGQIFFLYLIAFSALLFVLRILRNAA